ncbi:DUF1810 domain-containing protein [Rhizobium sp. TRM95111]|uniref:DUF1810 domain-containing protein n=1 Tax=Rhizobium alarense TaxID=2846851 RepID=UPI001F195CBE|nr:DUF1810 domain-containing protein [Rhizobium alarense]MCF3639725.1 DUF1810 domain-containing protein [Rhizobium alarense]
MDIPFDFERFVKAQQPVYPDVLAELRAGRKESHWMWFVFPQIAGLGTSQTARHYALSSVAEARAYLADPLLGTRLRECCGILLDLEGRSAEDIFGFPDVLKLRSSMTLFSHTTGGEGAFEAVLAKYYRGAADARTLALLRA